MTPVNDLPVAMNDVSTLGEGMTKAIDLADNDTDVDDGLDIASIAIFSPPAHASSPVVVKSDGTVDYTHDGSDAISDSFTYTIEDNSSAVSNPATVTIMVIGNFAAGQTKYDDACESCHAAGSYDTSKIKQATDLYSDGENLVTDLSSLGGMNNLSITPQELIDLWAFVEGIAP